MSTTPIESWAVDLAEVTNIYPMVGTEGILAVISIVLWIVWHIWQVRFENETFRKERELYGSPENLRNEIGDD